MIKEMSRKWQDQKIYQLYAIAMTSKYAILRQEILKILGALERAGSEDAIWALDDIKKHSSPCCTK